MKPGRIRLPPSVMIHKNVYRWCKGRMHRPPAQPHSHSGARAAVRMNGPEGCQGLHMDTTGSRVNSLREPPGAKNSGFIQAHAQSRLPDKNGIAPRSPHLYPQPTPDLPTLLSTAHSCERSRHWTVPGSQLPVQLLAPRSPQISLGALSSHRSTSL